MAEGQKIKFEKVNQKELTNVGADKIDPKAPLESYLAEYQWQNARANVTIESTGAVLSTHLDVNGDGVITNKELRQVDQTAKSVANSIGIAENTGNDLRRLTSTTASLIDVPAKEDDDKAYASKAQLAAEYKKEVKKSQADIDKIEQALDNFLGDKGLGKLYKPDGKLTQAEQQYFDSVVAPTIPDQKPEAEKTPEK